MGSCTQCQAGTCLDCLNQAGCAWYVNSIGALGGTCSVNGTTPTGVGTYTLAGACPACTGFANCTLCTAAENQTCGWYALPGLTGKCAEASPGFLYSKVSAPFCNGNVCAGIQNCTSCNNQSGSCQWYAPATSALAALYNPKCDINSTGIVRNTLYSSTTTCPPCADPSCLTCKADTGCDWLAVNVLGTSSFGQCVTTGTPVTGKTSTATCPATCQLYSCAACIQQTVCRWYTASSVQKDACDRSVDSSLYPFSTALTVGGTCPACKDSRCFECNNENGCGWYQTYLAGLPIPGTGACSPTASAPSNGRLIPNTDSKCAGSPSSAAVLIPGLFVFLGSFFV